MSLQPLPPQTPPVSLSSEKDPEWSSSSSSPSPPSPPPPPAAATSMPPLEILIALAAIYPTTLLLGSLFSQISPSAASSSSYWSQKGNFVNIIFVKRGWLWTTAAFLLHLLRLRRSSKPRALLRYALASAWWVLVTQWCFGPPVMDRFFLLSGGTCAAVIEDESVRDRMGVLTAAVTSAACKVAGGNWRGGHDLSGHTFLLTHASLFLLSEVGPTVSVGGAWGVQTWGVLGVLAVWWWMLLMTGIYFHTWREKLTGWVVSIVEWVVVYVWALRTQPELRAVIGVPGV